MSDVGSLKAKFPRIIPCPSRKARKFYELEDDPTPPVLQLLPVAGDLIKGHSFFVARTNVKLASYVMEEFEARLPPNLLLR